MSFVFFDTETTGLRKGLDQIVHFAAIKTDNDLLEVERFETRCRLLPYVVPNPMALRISGATIDRLNDRELPSHDAMVANIQRNLLDWSPSIFVGYNSIDFDEEMLRQALFQTLRPAFLTSNHRNGRADALTLMMAASAVSPAAIGVPMGSNGRATFRLAPMAAANNVTHSQAHDAMGDAEATLALSRLVRERSPDVWQRFVRFSNRAAVRDFVDSGEGFVLTEFFGGNAYHAPVVCVGQEVGTPNGRLCLTLDCDLKRLISSTDDDLQVALAERPSPIRRLRVNASPTVTALSDASEQMLNGKVIDRLDEIARSVRQDQVFCERLTTCYAANRPPWPKSPYVEKQIYDGFPSQEDERFMIDFHDASWPDAYSIVQRMQDERLRTFGLRLIYLGNKSTLPEDVRLDVEKEMIARLVDDGPEGYSLQRALRETDELLKDEPESEILSGYRDYLIGRIERVREFREKYFGINAADQVPVTPNALNTR